MTARTAGQTVNRRNDRLHLKLVSSGGRHAVFHRGACLGRFRNREPADQLFAIVQEALLGGAQSTPPCPRDPCQPDPADLAELLESDAIGDLKVKLAPLLDRHHVMLPDDDLAALAAQLLFADLHRRQWMQLIQRASELPATDILYWLDETRTAGDRDESLWRAFLAGHFGRSSASPDNPAQIESAARLLCAFGAEPVWTWQKVTRDPAAFGRWLAAEGDQLAALRFANHRTRRSHRPGELFAVIMGFVRWVQQRGNTPERAFETDPSLSPEERFDVLFNALVPIGDFGRLGRYDLLLLLGDCGLLQVRPGSCYLAGATGPLEGAKALWGDRSLMDLEGLSVLLAQEAERPIDAVESALCTWQK